MSNGVSGLYRSSNGGQAFAKVANVQYAFMFSFGTPPNGSKVPTVFLYGTVENTKGIFRSDDMGTATADGARPGRADEVGGSGAGAADGGAGDTGGPRQRPGSVGGAR